MRIIDLLTEAVSSVVYHYTNLDAAARILTTGEFALSSTLGSIEEKFAPKGYPYFLSTTRTRRGGYHSNAIGDGAAMFNLDGNYYNQRYKGGPIDYWGDRHNDYGRAAEAEDRIFSKEPTMSAGGITSVHIFVKPLPVAAVPGSSVDIRARESISSFAARARTALLAAKKAGIPAYLYEDRLGWVNQDPKARIAITGSRDTLRGQIPMYNPSHPPRQYMAKWLELIYKDSTKALSTQNFGDLHSLVYNDPYWLKEMVTSLSADLSNARKPSAGADREVAVKIISYMNRHGLHTVTDFIMALRKKWTIIKNKEQEAKYDAEQADYAKFQAKEKAAQPELAEGMANDMSTTDMISYLRQHHDANLHQDYLDHINTFSKFVLKDIPVSSIKSKLAGLDKAKVEQYKQMDMSTAPPIVMGDGYILDGYHRVNAVKAQGIPTIKGYVGVKRQPELAEQSLNEKVNQSVMQPGFKDTQSILGGKFKLLANSDGTRLTVNLYLPEADFWEDPVAYAKFDIKGFFFLKNLQSYKTWVEPEYRRMGLATAIYQYVLGLGNTIKPADVRTDMGKAMWKGFNKKGSLAESADPTNRDIADAAEWINTTPANLQIEHTQEPIEKYLTQIKEMYGTFDEFPQDKQKTNKIIKLIKAGAPVYPIYVEKGDSDLFVMEGRHRMVAFWLLGMKTIPVAYVSVKASELAESTDPILDFIHSLGNHDFFGGNCGVLAMALNEKFDMDEFLFVENDYEPERLYHVAATKNGKIYDGSGIITRAQLLEYGIEEDSRSRPKIIAVPAGEEFYRYIDRGTDPTLEVEDLL